MACMYHVFPLLLAANVLFGVALAAQSPVQIPTDAAVRNRREKAMQNLEPTFALMQQASAAVVKAADLPAVEKEAFRRRLADLENRVQVYRQTMTSLVTAENALAQRLVAYNANPGGRSAEFDSIDAGLTRTFNDQAAVFEAMKREIDPLARSLLEDIAQQRRAASRATADRGRFGYDENASKTLADAAKDLAETNKEKYLPAEATKCNEFVRDLVTRLLGTTPPELANGTLANQMHDNMDRSPAFERLNVQQDLAAGLQRGQELANQGNIVIATYRAPDDAQGKPVTHGHVAVLVPEVPGRDRWSGNWGMKVPLIAQAGERVFTNERLSSGFGNSKKDRMELYLYKKQIPKGK